MNSNVQRITDILNDDFESLDAFQTRFQIFLDETIKVGIENWHVLKIILSETYELSKFDDFNMSNLSSLGSVAKFIGKGQELGTLKSNFDPLMLGDNILALTMDQIVNWPMNKNLRQFDISNNKVRSKWIKENLRLYFQGVAN